MAKATTITRRAWQCPSCGRTFRIPQAAPPPLSCPDCESAAATTSSKRGKGGKPVVETTFFESEPEYQRAVRNTSSDAKPSQSAAVLESGSIETAEILEHLRNISHTMTTVRRIMWLFIGIMLMTIMFGLGSAFMMMQTLSGFLPIVQQVVQPVGNPANPNLQPPALNDVKGLDLEGVNLENMDDLNKVIDALNERNKLADSLLD